MEFISVNQCLQWRRPRSPRQDDPRLPRVCKARAANQLPVAAAAASPDDATSTDDNDRPGGDGDEAEGSVTGGQEAAAQIQRERDTRQEGRELRGGRRLRPR